MVGGAFAQKPVVDNQATDIKLHGHPNWAIGQMFVVSNQANDTVRNQELGLRQKVRSEAIAPKQNSRTRRTTHRKRGRCRQEEAL